MPHLAPNEKFQAGDEGMIFARSGGGHWLVQVSEGLVIDFGQVPDIPSKATRVLRPKVIEDRNGNAHYLMYLDGRLVTILTSCGKRLALRYDNKHNMRVALIGRQEGGFDEPIKPLAHYAYDSAGNLAQVRNAMGEITRSFAYDQEQRMIMHELPEGLVVHYEWKRFEGSALPEGLERSHSRVVGYRTNAGLDVRIDYALRGSGAGSATSSDQLGRVHLWDWDALRRVTHYRDPRGAPCATGLLGTATANGGFLNEASYSVCIEQQRQDLEWQALNWGTIRQ